MARDTLLDFFHDLAATRGEFLVHDDGYRTRSFSYGDVARAAGAFAARLNAAGLHKGDKAVIWSENRPEWLVAFWGCLLCGIIVVPIDYRSSKDFVERVLRIVGSRLLLVGDDVPLDAATAGGLSDRTSIWPLKDLEWTGTTQPIAQAGPDDLVEIIFTSGATAEPKGVLITHRNVLANIVPVEREILRYRKYGRPFFPLRFLNLLPLSHMFGQAMATFIPPMLAGTVVFMRGYNPNDIVRQIKKRRVSVLVSVPKILDVLKEHVLRIAPQASQSSTARSLPARWWRFRRVHRLFGLKFWSFVVGAAPLEAALEAFWSGLGFLVVQGYGLTETAPIVTLNHPFGTAKGSVGKPISGVEVRIAEDGEILVRGDNVTTGYYEQAAETAQAFSDGWFRTGDIGQLDEDGRLYIRGRKKEMIVTPEGLNVFPEDVERVLNQLPGVRESAVVGVSEGGEERVHAVLVIDSDGEIDSIVRQANTQLADHQKIRRASRWPGEALPRTEGTRKLKRREIKSWLEAGAQTQPGGAAEDTVEAVLAKYTGHRTIAADTTIDELGLTSLERVELMVALEDKFHTSLDETAFAGVRHVGELRALVEQAPTTAALGEPVDFPTWNRRWPVRVVRGVSLATWILPLAKLFAWIRVEGRQHLTGLEGPVLFAANHQSHMDTPAILATLPRRWRGRLATAMAKEFFKPHFFPEQHTRREWFTNSLNYYLSTFFFNAFPLPQREAGARQTLRYIGELTSEGFSVLIFPEGSRTDAGEIKLFRPGVGMIASRLHLPVVPVRLEGLDRVLHHSWKMARPGRVRVAFGAPLRLVGDDYVALAKQVEDAVRALSS